MSLRPCESAPDCVTTLLAPSARCVRRADGRGKRGRGRSASFRQASRRGAGLEGLNKSAERPRRWIRVRQPRRRFFFRAILFKAVGWTNCQPTGSWSVLLADTPLSVVPSVVRPRPGDIACRPGASTASSPDAFALRGLAQFLGRCRSHVRLSASVHTLFAFWSLAAASSSSSKRERDREAWRARGPLGFPTGPHMRETTHIHLHIAQSRWHTRFELFREPPRPFRVLWFSSSYRATLVTIQTCSFLAVL